MASQLIQIPDEEIIKIIQGVIDNYLKPSFIELGMNATGQWLNSLEPRANQGNGEIWGMDYTYYLANGRKPGNAPPVSALLPWVTAKFGISGQQALGVAFAVSKKIAKEGTEYYPDGTDLISMLNSDEVKIFITTSIQNYISSEVTIIIKKRLNDNFSRS